MSQQILRTALIHYWLLGSRGGEKVLEAICRIFPEADIFTLFYDPGHVSASIRSHRIHASFLNPLRACHRLLLPLMPLALESFDLRGYDLVISSESGPAKGVITNSQVRHICYCHTPMRYLWELYPAYRNDFGENLFRRTLMAPFASYLRTWDVTTAARVDTFVANSWNVRKRIWKTYRRRASVIHPPVAVNSFYDRPSEDFFLTVAEMVPYKRLDYAVRAFAKNGRRLKLVGEGPEYHKLRRLASSNIEFCGRVSDTDLRELYARSSALVVPGEEDFGITTVESLASGKPVIALKRGGSVEILRDHFGVMYDEPNEHSLECALRAFDCRQHQLRAWELKLRAFDFSEEAFEDRFRDLIARNPLMAKEIPKKTVPGIRQVASRREFTSFLQVPDDLRSANNLTSGHVREHPPGTS